MSKKKTTRFLPEKTVTIPREEWQNIKEQAVKSEECRERLLRLAAEFDNYRKRTASDKKQWALFSESNLLQKLLPVLDSIEQALKNDEKNKPGPEKSTIPPDASVQGLKMVLQELHKTLDNLGLKPLRLEGKPFDPTDAEAVEIEETDDYPENTVVKTLRTGYSYRETLLRPAIVAISRKKSTESEPGHTPPDDEQNGHKRPGQD